jgi:hypothetical protein
MRLAQHSSHERFFVFEIHAVFPETSGPGIGWFGLASAQLPKAQKNAATIIRYS